MQAMLSTMLINKASQNILKTSTQKMTKIIFKKWLRLSKVPTKMQKCRCDDNRNLNISDDAKLLTWKDHYQRLLNVEFPYNESSINITAAVEGPTIFITELMMIAAVKKMKQQENYHVG